MYSDYIIFLVFERNEFSLNYVATVCFDRMLVQTYVLLELSLFCRSCAGLPCTGGTHCDPQCVCGTWYLSGHGVSLCVSLHA